MFLIRSDPYLNLIYLETEEKRFPYQRFRITLMVMFNFLFVL